MTKEIKGLDDVIEEFDEKFKVDKQMADTDYLHGDGLTPIKDANGILVDTNGKVRATSPASMSIEVLDLLGLIDGFHIGNRSLTGKVIATPVITAADATNPRIDAVVLKIGKDAKGRKVHVDDIEEEEAKEKGAIVEVIAGIPAASPVKPDIPASTVLLAYINVAAGATSIIDENIVDARDYLLDIDELNATLSEKIAKNAQDIDALDQKVTELKATVDTELATIKTDIAALTSADAALQASIDTINGELANIYNQLDIIEGDIAGILADLAPGGIIGSAILANKNEIVKLRADLEQLRADAEGVDAALQAAIDDILNNKLPPLETALASAITDISGNALAINNVQTSLEAEVLALQNRVQQLEEQPPVPPDLYEQVQLLQAKVEMLEAAGIEGGLGGVSLADNVDLDADYDDALSDFAFDKFGNVVLPIVGAKGAVFSDDFNQVSTVPDQTKWGIGPLGAVVVNNMLRLRRSQYVYTKGLSIVGCRMSIYLDWPLPGYSEVAKWGGSGYSRWVSFGEGGKAYYRIIFYYQLGNLQFTIDKYRWWSERWNHIYRVNLYPWKYGLSWAWFSSKTRKFRFTYLAATKQIEVECGVGDPDNLVMRTASMPGVEPDLTWMTLYSFCHSQVYTEWDNFQVVPVGVDGQTFALSGTYQTKAVANTIRCTSKTRQIKLITEELLDDAVACSITWDISLDGGANWINNVAVGTVLDVTGAPFNGLGSFPVIRANLATTDDTKTPRIKKIILMSSAVGDISVLIAKVNELVAWSDNATLTLPSGIVQL